MGVAGEGLDAWEVWEGVLMGVRWQVRLLHYVVIIVLAAFISLFVNFTHLPPKISIRLFILHI